MHVSSLFIYQKKANQKYLMHEIDKKNKTYTKHKIRSLLCDDKKCCLAYDKKFMCGGYGNFRDAKGWNTCKVEQ